MMITITMKVMRSLRHSKSSIKYSPTQGINHSILDPRFLSKEASSGTESPSSGTEGFHGGKECEGFLE